jgi:4-amino-4-deoxy-L-arabinose transferase-like glycosyltransferase
MDNRYSGAPVSSAGVIQRRTPRPLWKAGVLAAVLAAGVNFALYVIYYATGILPWSMFSPGRGVSITPQLVTVISMGGAAAGTLIYALLNGFPNRSRIFRWVALVILVISFAAPLMMTGFTPILTVALDAMHAVVAVATVWALTIWKEGPALTASA